MKKLKKYNPDGIHAAHGCKEPDTVYLNHNYKQLVIVEKKCQNCPGSVCEKLQTAGFKRGHYRSLIPEYRVEYVYILSDWFRSGAPAEIEFLERERIPVFWGDESDWNDKLRKYLSNLLPLKST